MFGRLTKEKATLAREIEKMGGKKQNKKKNPKKLKQKLSFAWPEENVSVPVFWEEKPKNTQCVSAIA